MRLQSLEIKNFRVLKNVRLDFPDEVIGIIGPNGAGKTSIIEAIAWALYGNQAARSGKNEIRSMNAGSKDNCEVCLDFSVKDENYRVVRRLVGLRERPEVHLFRGGSSESVGVNETISYVGQLLGLDWKGFVTSFLARQQELNALSDLQPTKRRDHLAGMLGIEVLDKAIQRVKEDSRLSADRVKIFSERLAESPLIQKAIEELQKEIRELSGKSAQSKSELDSATAAHQKAEGEYLHWQKLRSAATTCQAKLEAQKETSSNLARQLQMLTEEKEALMKSSDELTLLKQRLKGYERLKIEKEELSQVDSRVRFRAQLQKQLGETTFDVERISHELDDATSSMQRLERDWVRIPADIEKLHDSKKTTLDEVREEYSTLREEKASLDSEISKVRQQIRSISEFGPDSICERCLRPLGDELPEIEKHLAGELKSAEQKLETIDLKLQKKLKEGEHLKKQTEELTSHVQVKIGLESEKKSLTLKRQDLLISQKKMDSRKSDLSRQLAPLSKLQINKDRFEQVNKKVQELERLKSRHDELTGKVGRLGGLQKQIAEIELKLGSVHKVIEGLEIETEKLGFSQPSFEQHEKKYAASRKNLEDARGKYLELAKELELAQKGLEGKTEQLQKLQKEETELQKSRSDQYFGEKLRRLFSEYRQLLISGIRPTLSELSSRLISDMTGGKYSMVDLDEKYNLQVMDSGSYFPVERYSGGEKDLANLCLRLAISLALTESAGLERSFIILDEVFGSQDDERKELILNSLVGLKKRFPQILLITHIEELKNRVERLIEIQPTSSGWSEVRVNGQVCS